MFQSPPTRRFPKATLNNLRESNFSIAWCSAVKLNSEPRQFTSAYMCVPRRLMRNSHGKMYGISWGIAMDHVVSMSENEAFIPSISMAILVGKHIRESHENHERTWLDFGIYLLFLKDKTTGTYATKCTLKITPGISSQANIASGK